MNDTLAIIGLCLLIPSIAITVGFSIYEIVEMFKEDIRIGLLLIVSVMAFVGMMCLIFAIP